MTLNVHNFKSILKNKSKEDIAKKLAKYIAYHDIDICCFQEYYS